MFIDEYIKETISTKEKILNDNTIKNTINMIVEKLVEAYKNDNKMIIAGNGGSAADSQHIACEMISKLNINRKALNAHALNTNTSVITSIGNDFGFEFIFSRQIEAIGKPGDIFIALSTSGESTNIINALIAAKKNNIITLSITGMKYCQVDKISDYVIKIPSAKTPIIQESQIMIGHIICSLVEKQLFYKEKNKEKINEINSWKYPCYL